MKRTLPFVTAGVVIAFSTLGFGVHAHADGLSDTQIQSIEALVTSFGAGSDVISNLDAALRGTTLVATPPSAPAPAPAPVSAPTSSTPACAAITHYLAPGTTDVTTGGDVTKVQETLSASGAYSGPITGYFGAQTEQAVQTFQNRNGIVSAGTPDSTGYGAVGPLTRSALAASCTSATGSSGSGAAPVVTAPLPTSSWLFANPASGTAPLTVSFSADLGGLASGDSLSNVNVEYGDGKGALVCYLGLGGYSGCPSIWTATHAYAAPGIYTASITRAPGAFQDVDIIGTTSVTVVAPVPAGTSISTDSSGSTSGTGTTSGSGTGTLGGGGSTVPPPVISSLNNTVESSGYILGQNFTTTSAVYVVNSGGTKTSLTFTVASDTRLNLAPPSPQLPLGVYYLYITNQGGTTKDPTPFLVLTP